MQYKIQEQKQMTWNNSIKILTWCTEEIKSQISKKEIKTDEKKGLYTSWLSKEDQNESIKNEIKMRDWDQKK